MYKYGIVGVDEVGRGPLAGPVAVGVIYVPQGQSIDSIQGIRDSKQLSAKQREALYSALKKIPIRYAVSMVSSRTIDTKGIQYAIHVALCRALKRVGAPKEARILLDGGLHAPKEFKNQITIVRGDAKEPIIGAASILAKVTRDRYMIRMHRQYPVYGFASHKGYGTTEHRSAIQKHGMVSIHRQTFCTRVV